MLEGNQLKLDEDLHTAGKHNLSQVKMKPAETAILIGFVAK
jgi:hypothetical protein